MKNLKKTISKLLLFITLLNGVLFLNMSLVFAEGEEAPAAAPTAVAPEGGVVPSPQQYLQSIGNTEETKLPQFNFGQHPEAAADYAQEGVGAVTSPVYFAIDLFRYVISGIALVVIVMAALKLVSVSGEEEATEVKKGLTFGILGLLVVQLADIVVKKMFFGEQGEAFEDAATSQLFAEESVTQLRGIIGFVEFFLGAVAVLVIVIRGFTLMVAGSDEEAVTKAKKHVMYALVGLLAVGLSEIVVRGVIFPDAGKSLPDVDKGKYVLIMITNYASGFVAIICFLMLFFAGYKYVAQGSQEDTSEKVRKIFMGAVIGLVLAFGAFAAVNTLVKMEAPADTAEVDLPESK